MDQSLQRIGLVNWVALLVAASASYWVATDARSATGLVGAAFLGIGFLVALVSYFQMGLYQRERAERLEFEEIIKSKASATLFNETEAEAFPAQRSREQFERFLVPLFTVGVLILQTTTVYQAWQWLSKAQAPAAGREALVMALYALMALILFLLGKYSSRLARSEPMRLAGPGASYLMLGAILCFVTALTEAAAKFEFKRADVYTARVLCVVLALVSIETLVSLILEIYRPRMKGQAARVLYESRLIGLLGQPGGIITTAAQALDYQFGFKVSETWVYRYLEKAFAWLVLLQIGVLFLSTAMVVIEPYEQGLLERFGKPVAGRNVLEPGFHVKWPWPVDKVHRHRTLAIQSFTIGEHAEEEGDGHDDDHGPKPAAQAKTVLWTKAHFAKDEFNLLVASREAGMFSASGNTGGADEQAVPVNLLTASIPVQYRITDLKSWAYKHANPSELLERLATREVVRYLANVDIDDLLGSGRLAASEGLRKTIQERANQSQLGVEILLVGLQDIHPPVKVADAYEQVIGAIMEGQTNVLAAQAYALERIPFAHSEATNMVTGAEAERVRKAVTAAAEARLYTNQIIAHRAAPSVYIQRAQMETLARSISGSRKYVLGVTNTQDVFTLNLEDKIAPGLLDVEPPTTKKK